MKELYIYQRNKPSAKYQVWPKAEHIPAGSVREAESYIFELQNIEDPLSVDLLVDDIALEALRPSNATTAIWLWSPGFHAGSVECCLTDKNGRKIYFEVISDPDLNKLSRNEYNLLLEEILQDTFALFSLSSFRKGMAKGDSHTLPPIARLQYLKEKVDQLCSVVEDINKRPQRILHRKRLFTPFHKAKRVTGNQILRSFKSGNIKVCKNPALKLPLALKTMLPARIEQEQIQSGLDTREHREIKASLNHWKSWLSRMASLLDKHAPSSPDDVGQGAKSSYLNWSRKCKIMESKLQHLLSLPLFSQIPLEPLSPKLSSTYRNLPPYRKFYKIFREFNLGLANIFGDFLQMPLARTFDL